MGELIGGLVLLVYLLGIIPSMVVFAVMGARSDADEWSMYTEDYLMVILLSVLGGFIWPCTAVALWAVKRLRAVVEAERAAKPRG